MATGPPRCVVTQRVSVASRDKPSRRLSPFAPPASTLACCRIATPSLTARGGRARTASARTGRLAPTRPRTTWCEPSWRPWRSPRPLRPAPWCSSSRRRLPRMRPRRRSHPGGSSLRSRGPTRPCAADSRRAPVPQASSMNENLFHAVLLALFVSVTGLTAFSHPGSTAPGGQKATPHATVALAPRCDGPGHRQATTCRSASMTAPGMAGWAEPVY